MRVAHYYAAMQPPSGVTAAIKAWASLQQEHGHAVTILHAGQPTIEPSLSHVEVSHFGNSRMTWLPHSIDFGSIDLLYLHEGWTPAHYAAARAAQRAGVAYVVMPHGVYEPQILRRLHGTYPLRAWPERWMLERAAGVHVFFQSESDLVRRVAPRARTFAAPTPFSESSQPPSWQGGDYFAWFGRFDPEHKGLDLLLEAMRLLPPARRPRLRLHGVDFNGGLARTRQLVSVLSLEPHVTIGPPVYGDEKRQLVAGARAFVHPSRWESHSISILEVLQEGVPLVINDNIHVASTLADARAAVTVTPTPQAWARVLGAEDPRLDALRPLEARPAVMAAFSPTTVMSTWLDAMANLVPGSCGAVK